ncbi:MAG TPA: chemotaxis protein CheB [Actinomycetota bacterium]|nr:chemotaxis protein CheB [Actinomycetota bacterium]
MIRASHRDIIVIGASAGGVTALKGVIRELPPDLPASLFVVLHTVPRGVSQLAPILDAAGPLRASFAEDGEGIRYGHVYVAPPDRHLLLRDSHVHLTRAPKENRTRPAVNPLFRSAAAAYGRRVVGVVLTGTLDNGTAGLLAVEAGGGTTVVQDPEDAEFPGMPLSALDYLDPDHVVTAAELPGLLVELVGEEMAESGPERLDGAVVNNPGPDDSIGTHQRGPGPDLTELGSREVRPPNTASGFTCPECSGALWEVEERGLTEYVCRIGHLFGPETLLEEHAERRDDLLETALRSIEEESALTARLLERGRERGLSEHRLRRHVQRIRTLERTAASLEHLLREESPPAEAAE